MMGGDGLADDEFAAIAGPGADGTLMTFSPDPRTNPKNKPIVDLFRKRGFEPQAYTLYSYAAVQIIKQAAEEANSLDPKKVAEVIRSGRPFDTVLGDALLRQEGRRVGQRLSGRRQEEGPLRPLHLEKGPGRQDFLLRGRGGVAGAAAPINVFRGGAPGGRTPTGVPSVIFRARITCRQAT